jgi:NADPH:quinone reductase-like Zn-dependent oxidoreductase
MKAVVCDRYGPPEVLQIMDVEKPVPTDSQVLIEVRAAAVNPLDAGGMKGKPFLVRIMTGLRKPKASRPGVDLAGEVQAVGKNVTQFKPGDEVFGVCIRNPQASGTAVWEHQGAFAEYVCAPESTMAMKPPNITFEQAAAAPVAGFTALQGLRDHGRVRPGQRVLINGAAGGVGTFAVQIAKSFDAQVTGVCSTRNVDMVRSIGADHVVDYNHEDFTQRGQQYDVIFDCVGNQSLSACRRVLTPKGIYIMVGELSGRGMIALIARVSSALILSRFVSHKLVMFLARPNQRDLSILCDLMSTGKVVPVIDKRYPLSEVSQAIRYLDEKHARGKVIIIL